MQIEQIETFLDLCETRSFHKTAERLGVTQSTVSGRMRSLEAGLGCRLFTRSRAGTALTTAGLRFEPHARSLRHGLAEARAAARADAPQAMHLRVGIQHDLAENHIGDWVRIVRGVLPEVGMYIEADYSIQMCADLISGGLDLALAYSPRPHPDLHFESVGEVIYRMVSTGSDDLSAQNPATYIRTNTSPAFAQTHAALFPTLASSALSAGQNAAIVDMLRSIGGAAFVTDEAARLLAVEGTARRVRKAAAIPQTVYAVVHLRNRHRGPYRRILRALRERFVQATPVEAMAQTVSDPAQMGK